MTRGTVSCIAWLGVAGFAIGVMLNAFEPARLVWRINYLRWFFTDYVPWCCDYARWYLRCQALDLGFETRNLHVLSSARLHQTGYRLRILRLRLSIFRLQLSQFGDLFMIWLIRRRMAIGNHWRGRAVVRASNPMLKTPLAEHDERRAVPPCDDGQRKCDGDSDEDGGFDCHKKNTAASPNDRKLGDVGSGVWKVENTANDLEVALVEGEVSLGWLSGRIRDGEEARRGFSGLFSAWQGQPTGYVLEKRNTGGAMTECEQGYGVLAVGGGSLEPLLVGYGTRRVEWRLEKNEVVTNLRYKLAKLDDRIDDEANDDLTEDEDAGSKRTGQDSLEALK